MVESKVEAYFRRQVQHAGGRALKFVSPGNAGVPDRLALFPGGRIVFVELKAPGKKPRALQRRWMDRLAALGFSCWVIDNKPGVDEFLREVVSNDIQTT